MNSLQPQTEKRHLLTVLLEDYFHVGAFDGLIQRGQWYRFETRFEQNTIKALDLLDRFDVKATFFVTGWVADRQPEIVREVARRGHEIASRGLYQRRRTRRMTLAEFRDDLRRTRDSVEQATGTKAHGFRAARRWSSPTDLWMLDVLAEEGYAYDSSLVPIAHGFNNERWRQFAHQHQAGGGESIWEFPLSTANLLGWRMPIAGGNFFRQIPHAIMQRAVEHWHRSYEAPFVMYAHIWEFDPDQPRISGASQLTKLRHYRNLDKMSGMLEDYFKKYRFTGIARYLGLDAPAHNVVQENQDAARAREVETRVKQFETGTERRRPVLTLAPETATHSIAHVDASAPAAFARTPVTVVVPCYNEAPILPYLANTLKSVESSMREDYDLRFVFVDDCSTDRTGEELRRLFGSWPGCTFVRHERNLGVAAAILNGVRHAETEIVCSIDCDCTYDPHALRDMIPLLAEDVAMVTASPYHPQGRVRNVPNWRLSLSKAASFLYRRVVRQRLHTYTSCFRAYRRSAVLDLRLRETGFLGVAETLGRLDLRGEKIVEYPATLEVRLFGQSKMKIVRTVGGHLRLLARLAMIRVRQDKSERRHPTLPTDVYAPATTSAPTPVSQSYQPLPTRQERT